MRLKIDGNTDQFVFRLQKEMLIINLLLLIDLFVIFLNEYNLSYIKTNLIERAN